MELLTKYARILHRKHPRAVETWGVQPQDRATVDTFRAAGKTLETYLRQSSAQGWPDPIQPAGLYYKGGYQALKAGVQLASPVFGGAAGFVLHLALSKDGLEADIRPAGSKVVGDPLKKIGSSPGGYGPGEDRFALPTGAELTVRQPLGDILQTIVNYRKEDVGIELVWEGSSAPKTITLRDKNTWISYGPDRKNPLQGACFHQDPHLETSFCTPLTAAFGPGFRTARWSEPRGGYWTPDESTSKRKDDLVDKAAVLAARIRALTGADSGGRVAFMVDALEVGDFELELK